MMNRCEIFVPSLVLDVFLIAGDALPEEVKGKTSALEAKWIADAKAKGLANPEQVIKDYRAEIAKQ